MSKHGSNLTPESDDAGSTEIQQAHASCHVHCDVLATTHLIPHGKVERATVEATMPFKSMLPSGLICGLGIVAFMHITAAAASEAK